MAGFETHPRGTAEEIRLSRELAREIEKINEQFRGAVPQPIWAKFKKLNKHYQLQMETET